MLASFCKLMFACPAQNLMLRDIFQSLSVGVPGFVCKSREGQSHGNEQSASVLLVVGCSTQVKKTMHCPFKLIFLLIILLLIQDASVYVVYLIKLQFVVLLFCAHFESTFFSHCRIKKGKLCYWAT